MRLLRNVQRLLVYRQGAARAQAAVGFFLGTLIAVALLQQVTRTNMPLKVDEWQLTPADRAPLTAILFHGCSNEAATWKNGPLERGFVAAFQQAKVSIVALSSSAAEAAAAGDENAAHRCWDSDTQPDRNRDVQRALAVAGALQKRQRGVRRRLVGIGASSGGSFVSLLAAYRPDIFDAIAVYISPLNSLFMLAVDVAIRDASPKVTPSLPAVLAVHMPERDPATALMLQEQRQQLLLAASRRPCPAASAPGKGPEACIGVMTALPHALSGASILAMLPRRITIAAAAELMRRLQAAGVIAPSAGTVNSDASPAVADHDQQFDVVSQPRLGTTRQLVQQFCNELQPAAAAEHAAALARCRPGMCYPDDTLLELIPASAAVPATANRKAADQARSRHGAGAHASGELHRAQTELARWLLELLNEAYAEHEMTAQHAGDVAQWLVLHANAAAEAAAPAEAESSRQPL